MKRLFLFLLTAGCLLGQSMNVTVQPNGAGTGTFNNPQINYYLAATGQTWDFRNATVYLPASFSSGVTQIVAGSNISISPSGGTGIVTISSTGGGGSGSVSSVGLSMPSGFSVSNSPITTSGTIGVTTSLSGLIKGTGSGFTTATSGTDYAPATSGSSLLYGNGAGGFSNVTIGSGLTFSGGTLAAVSGGGGTVTNVTGTGTVNGITLTGNVSTSGSLTLGGTLSGVSLTSQVSGTLPVANGGTGVTTSTGTGSTVLSASPTFTGTLTAANLTATGTTTLATSLSGALQATSGVVSAISNTGTGSNVLATSPTLVTPILGVPQSVTLTNGTGLPLSTGVTGTLPVGNGGTGATTLTGLVKGNGTSAFTAATSGTDYAPATSGTSILYGNGSGGFSNVTIGSGLTFSAGTLTATSSGGTVTSFSAGNLSPLFTTSVATSTTTPALSFSLSTAAANTMLGNNTGSTASPAYNTISSYLDNAFSSTQGAMLYRSGTAWVALPIGTAGQLLTANGSGANPSWTTYTGSSSITTIGTLGTLTVSGSAYFGNIFTGSWYGGTIGVVYGGTGATSAAGANQNLTPSTATITQGTGLTVNWGTSNAFYLSLGANSTITTFSNAVDGQTITIEVKQNGGSYTLTWPSAVKWSGGTAPTMTATNGKYDVYTFIYNSSLAIYFGSYVQNY